MRGERPRRARAARLHPEAVLNAEAGPPPRDLALLVERTEAAAYADLLRAAPAGWRCVAEETAAGWLLIAPTLDLLLFNRLIGAGVGAALERPAFAEAVRRLAAAGVANWGVQLSPEARPADCPAWLGEAGLAARDRWSKVYRAATPAAAVETAVEVRAAGAGEATLFGQLMTRGFGMPPALGPWVAGTVGRPGWRHFLAWSGGEPVASAALFVHGDAGWLGMASTLPAARGRGAQGALMAARIEAGRSLGCRWLVTETSEELPARPNPSFHNMVRAGFTLAYQRANWMPRVSVHA